MLLASLALAALLSAPEAPASPPPGVVATGGPLAGCRVTIATLAMIFLECPGSVVLMLNEQDKHAAESTKRLARKLAEKEGTGLRQVLAPARLAGMGGTVRRYSVGTPPAYVLDGLAFQPPGAPARSYNCIAAAGSGGEATCARLLTALARDGVPEPYASLIRVPTEATVAGRTITPPDGCSLKEITQSHGRLFCENGSNLVWFTGEGALFDQLRASLAGTTESQLRDGRWEEDLPCRLEGTATRCRHRIGRKDGVTFEAWLATAQVRGTGLVAWCLHPEAEPFPPVCRLILDVAPGGR